MVYLGGPRRRRGRAGTGIYLHDPPPGYHPERPRISSKQRQRLLRREWLLMRSLTVVLVLVVLALAGLFGLFIALHG